MTKTRLISDLVADLAPGHRFSRVRLTPYGYRVSIERTRGAVPLVVTPAQARFAVAEIARRWRDR